MVTCMCGAVAAADDSFCQQCGQRLPLPAAVVAPAPGPGWGTTVGARLDRFAAEGRSGGLVRGSLADAAAVVRQEPRRAAAAMGVVMGVALVGFLVIGTVTFALVGGLLAAFLGSTGTSTDPGAGAVAALGGILAAWFILPAVGGYVSAVTVSVAGAAKYLPLLGRLPGYQHRGLQAVGSRWGRSVGSTMLAWLVTMLAYQLCVLPGLYVFARVAFTPHEAIAGRQSTGRGPLGRSWDRTGTPVWSILGLVVLAGLIAVLPLVLVGIVLVLVSALFGDSDSGAALVVALPLALLGAVALAFTTAAPSLPLAAAWLRLTSDEPPVGLGSAMEASGAVAASGAGGGVATSSPAPESSTRVCRACGAVVPPEHRFCVSCGTPLSA